MRTKHNRLARENRFYGILSAVRGEAFPDEYDARDAVPALKVTSRIEEHAVRIRCAAGERFAGDRDTQRQSAQVCPDFSQSFDMPSRKVLDV